MMILFYSGLYYFLLASCAKEKIVPCYINKMNSLCGWVLDLWNLWVWDRAIIVVPGVRSFSEMELQLFSLVIRDDKGESRFFYLFCFVTTLSMIDRCAPLFLKAELIAEYPSERWTFWETLSTTEYCLVVGCIAFQLMISTLFQNPWDGILSYTILSLHKRRSGKIPWLADPLVC